MKKTKPTVVVVIPYYNGAKWVERALISIFAQTIPADEVIVVNDGSTEEEKAALYKFAEKYPFQIIDKQNGGQGTARNVGVAATKSEYICFLDQDDFFKADHIETLLNAIPEKDCKFGFVYGDLAFADGSGNIIYAYMIRHRSTHPKWSVPDMLRFDLFILPSASLISRAAYEDIGGFDPQFTGYEDDDLFLRIFRKGYSNYFIQDSVTVWCVHGESTSYSIKMSQSRLRYFKKLVHDFPDDLGRDLAIFHDCLMPRFGPTFRREALIAKQNGSPDQDELVRIFCEYEEIVRHHPHVPMQEKRKLALIKFFLTCPFSLFNVARVVARVPGLKLLRRSLL